MFTQRPKCRYGSSDTGDGADRKPKGPKKDIGKGNDKSFDPVSWSSPTAQRPWTPPKKVRDGRAVAAKLAAAAAAAKSDGAKAAIADSKTAKAEFRKFMDKFKESKYVKKKLQGLNIDKTVVAGIMSSFAEALKADEIPYLSRELATRSMLEKANMERVLFPALYQYVRENLKDADVSLLDTLTKFSDLRTPAEWFPEARLRKRRIICHVGPTNSGKTHAALKRFEAARSAIYAGPLRLLAHEVYERMSAAGTPCNLLTGEERRESDGVDKWSATVEMVPQAKRFEVGVLDEIQMIADEQRGWAWTQALLGLQADEVHVCGEASAVELVKRICETTGEEVEVHTYDRLTPLVVENEGLDGSLTNLKKGDCIVTFSRKRIFALRRQVELYSKSKTAVIYGNLPPETRAEQARLFNDQSSDLDILIASDAIGMGLNLNIRRVIFETMKKFNGKDNVKLSVSQVKQIGGRAGRFRTANETGYVTTLNNNDIKRLKQCMEIPMAPALTTAGLQPLLEQLEAFAEELPGETFSGLLDKFEDLARLDGDYFLCNLENQKAIADLIQPLPLSLRDRYVLVAAPTNADDPYLAAITLRFARDLADGRESSLDAIVKLPKEPTSDIDKLKVLEMSHKAIILYMWLGFRFPSVFTEVDTASHLKRVAEDLINASLASLSEKDRRR
ncbi:ATP-dependent RNA helicase supv3l1, mitochondrial, partial [Irineochytrium annulatum]